MFFFLLRSFLNPKTTSPIRKPVMGSDCRRAWRAHLRVERFEDRVVPATLHVGTQSGEYTQIQQAVMAADPGDTIQIDPGADVGPVSISTNSQGVRLDNLTIQGGGNNTAITVAAGSIQAIVSVSGAENVTLKQLTIEGPVGTSTIGYGIYVVGGGSATIQQDSILNIHDSPLNASDDGVAIEVGNDLTGATGSATIQQDTISGYQKGGIVVENYSSATIDQNTITGLGGSTTVVQNGVQVSTGSSATIDQNTIADNVYTPQAGLGATGIILGNEEYTNGGPGTVTIDQNKMTLNDFAIFVYGPTTGPLNVSQNQIMSSNIGGIILENVSGADLSQNQISNTTEAINNNDAGGDGIYMYDSTGNTFNQNQLQNNAWDGIEVDDSTGNIFIQNQGQNNGNDGLQLDNLNDPGNSTGNVLKQNQFQHSGVFDIEDDTSGSGTAGTGNAWSQNQGNTIYPTGINNNNNSEVLATLQVGGGAYSTIQAALAAALPGDKIQVNQGTYAGPVVVSTNSQGVGLTDLDIEGGGNNTIITGGIDINGATGVIFNNFTVQGPSGTPGIEVEGGGSATLTNDTITTGGIGIEIGNPSTGTTAAATISHDTITGTGTATGILATNLGSSSEIDHTTVTGGAYGIEIGASASANLSQNTITSATSVGIDLLNTGFVTATQNTLKTDAVGIDILGPSYQMSQVSLSQNQIQNSTTDGLVLSNVTGALVSQNQIQNSGIDGIMLINGSTGNDFESNQSQKNGNDGIYVDSTSTGNIFNSNQMQNNGHLNVQDQTTGAVADGTGNDWTNNHGKTSNDSGIVS